MYVFCLLFPPQNENQAVKPCENLKDMTRETMTMMTMGSPLWNLKLIQKLLKGQRISNEILPQLNVDQSR